MRAVLAVLERVNSANRSLLQTEVNLPAGRIDAILKILEVEGAVIRVPGGRYQRTLTRWQPDEERVAMVTERRYQELDQMRAYMEHRGCLMQFLAQALDDPHAAPCGRCVTEAPEATVMTSVDEALVREAATFLRGSFRAIDPRKKWPMGAIPHLNGWIDPQNEPGMALAIYEDAGWGKDVARGKYHDGRLSDEVVAAAAALIKAQWSPNARDGWWVTAIPSHRHPGLVSDAAERLAKALNVPYRGEVLSIRNTTPEQKSMTNSAQQLRNIHAGLDCQGAPQIGPVILVDDIVDSRWTLTMGGYLLRTHGAGPVYPFAFAQASTRVDG
jgi:ATP-dependent DNA helicase RecQ